MERAWILVVDLVVLGVQLRKDADVGDEEIGIRNAIGIDVLRQHGAILHGEAVEIRAAHEERTDPGLDVGFQPAKETVELLGGLHGPHSSGLS